MNSVKTTLTLLAVLLPAVAYGAPIFWGSAQNTVAGSNVLTSGAFVEAFNASNSNSGSVTLNGVQFDNTTGLLPLGGAVGMLSGANTGDAALNAFLNTLNYGGGTSEDILIGGGNLNIGSSYWVQVFFTDLRSCCSSRDMLFAGDSGSSVSLDATGSGLGQFAVGKFTADGVSQVLNITTSNAANVHITGYQVRAVPVPPTIALLGLGLLGLAVGLRRKA